MCKAQLRLVGVEVLWRVDEHADDDTGQIY